ncbi:hypothetical protein [Ekhidna sp. To15]|uniref:hypothetical protein n=1 Tax=Ekhidna sp. To15 TaxID=3395267 RepID=UPI003F51E51A
MIWVLLQNLNESANEGEVGVHFDNSVSSTIDNASLKVENGIRQLHEQFGALVYFDNQEKKLIDRKTEISLSSGTRPQSRTWKVLVDKFNKNGLSSHYLFSDYQALKVSDLEESLMDSTKKYFLVITNDLNVVRNVSVDSLYLMPNQENLSEISIFVRFKVNNMETGSVVVKLMNGSRQLSSVVKDIEGLKEVSFDLSKDAYGGFEIVLDGDDVTFDNTFYFSVSERLKPKIVIIESPSSEALKAVYDNQELFDVDFQSINNLDYEALQEADLVVISSQYSVLEAIQNLSNTNFIVFPTDSVDILSYEKFIDVSLETSGENVSETSIDSEHPLLKGVFERRVEEQSMPVGRAMFSIGRNFEPIIKFRDGNPFLLKKNNIYFFNTTLESSSGGFQSHALFLPILFQIAFSSTGGIEPPYYYPEGTISVSRKASDVPVKLVRDGYEVIPTFNSNGSEMILELPNDLEAGEYQLIQDNDTLKSISINIPKIESIMQAPDFDEMREAFVDMKHVEVTKLTNGSDNVVFASGSQSSLWKYALILIVFLILTETVLHRYLR